MMVGGSTAGVESNEPVGVESESSSHRDRSGSMSSLPTTPTVPFAAAHQRMTPPVVPVDLITPRYQKKTRSSRQMQVTDSSQARFGTSEALRQRTVETLSIRHAGAEYHEVMRFRTYAVFRHGKHRVLSNSVGYSTDGDLVMVREDMAQKAVGDDATPGALEKRGTCIVNAVCLNPRARRPLTDTEAAETRKLNAPRFKKYPGIKCPKNRKLRNRLINDHWATLFMAKLGSKARGSDDSDSDDNGAAPPMFPESKMFQSLLHKEQEQQFAILERRGVSPTLRPVLPPDALRDPDSGEARYQALSAKLKDELKNALTSEFLTQQVADLDVYFTEYLRQKNEDNVPLRFVFRDGYCRLVCHGVAEYYQLVSRSVTDKDGQRVTLVSRPSKRSELLPPSTPLLQLLYQKKGRHNTSPPMGPMTPQTPFANSTSGDDGLPPVFSLDDPILYDAQCPRPSTGEMTQTQKKKLKRLQKEQAAAAAAPVCEPKQAVPGKRKKN